MAFIEQLLQIAYYIVAALVIVILVGGVVIIVTKKRKKQNFKGDYDSTDYANLTRYDSKDYIKIDDILENVIVADNWTRFIGVIDCAGFDFYSMSEEEQYMIMQNYIPFINTIDGPITFRQYCQSADMEDTLIRYGDALKKVNAQMEDVFLQIDELEIQHPETLSAENSVYYQSRMYELVKQIDVLEFRRLHLLDQLNYIEKYSGNNVAPLLTETYVFEWTTDKLEAADSMSREQIFMKARTELNSIAASKIHSLRASGVRARRCSTEELIDMFRRHSLPVSSERFKKSDLRKIDFSSDIITSDSMERCLKKVQEIKKALFDEQFNEMFDAITAETFDMLIHDDENISVDAEEQVINAVGSDNVVPIENTPDISDSEASEDITF